MTPSFYLIAVLMSCSSCSSLLQPSPIGAADVVWTGRKLTMDDFWVNDAHFELVSSSRFNEYGTAAANIGFHFVPRPGGVWYLFHREYGFADNDGGTPEYCTADYARSVVRRSDDKGVTWSSPTVVAAPGDASSADACAIVDGSGFFDSETDQWHFLAQCMNSELAWKLCHYTKAGSDPLSNATSWLPNPSNPVVVGGQLWGPICANSSNCPANHFHDEGTPEIVAKDAEGYFFVTFHGCNDDASVSARGVAKTRDFVQWETDGSDLPNDAIFAQVDCNSWDVAWWNGSCVGGGEASILDLRDGIAVDYGTGAGSGGYLYQLIEASDKSLGCLGEGQNWMLGLSRSSAQAGFAPAGSWEPFPFATPTIVPPEEFGCYTQYHRIFSDDLGTYLEYSVWTGDAETSGWMYVHQLVPGANEELPIVASNEHYDNTTAHTST